MRIEVIHGEKTKKALGTKLPAPISWGVKVTGGTTIYLAGACAFDENLKIVGDTLTKQYRKTLQNIQAVLEDAGATMNNIVKFVNYVVTEVTFEHDYSQIADVRNEFFKDDYYPPGTLVQVKGLMLPHQLIEVDAWAVID